MTLHYYNPKRGLLSIVIFRFYGNSFEIHQITHFRRQKSRSLIKKCAFLFTFQGKHDRIVGLEPVPSGTQWAVSVHFPAREDDLKALKCRFAEAFCRTCSRPRRQNRLRGVHATHAAAIGNDKRCYDMIFTFCKCCAAVDLPR